MAALMTASVVERVGVHGSWVGRTDRLGWTTIAAPAMISVVRQTVSGAGAYAEGDVR